MSATHSYNLEVYNAKKFRESLAGPTGANVFFTIGKTLPWVDDNDPPQAETNIKSINEIWNNMVGGKRITTYDTNLCVPRYDWNPGFIYAQYDDITDDKSLNSTDSNFYVVTDEWNVYKCIHNNYGSVSTSKPSYTDPSKTNIEDDGYIWKYMYTVSSSDRLRFTTSTFLPITRNQEVINQAIPGEISSIVITNYGENYTSNNITISIVGDGTGAKATVERDTTNNSILRILLNDPGRGYTRANAVISSVVGVNATARVVLSPPGGHGSHPYEELGASYVIINPQLKGNEGGPLITDIDYRQIGLIEGPNLYNNDKQSSNSLFNQTMVLSLVGVGPEYQYNEIVYQGSDLTTSTFNGMCSKWDSSNGIIYLTNTQGTPKSDVLIGSSSSARRFISSITNPTFKSCSGRLLYMDNILPVERATDQTDSFQIILSF